MAKLLTVTSNNTSLPLFPPPTHTHTYTREHTHTYTRTHTHTHTAVHLVSSLMMSIHLNVGLTPLLQRLQTLYTETPQTQHNQENSDAAHVTSHSS